MFRLVERRSAKISILTENWLQSRLINHFVRRCTTIQVKALDGPNEGFVFPAVGQVQRNAYPGTSYGGVVFGYSADSIRMFVPADDTGTIIHIPENWGTAEYLQMSNNVEIIVTMWNTTVNNCKSLTFVML